MTSEKPVSPTTIRHQGLDITAWRRLAPARLRSCRSQLLALLSRLTAFDDPTAKARLTRAMAGDANAALDVAQMLGEIAFAEWNGDEDAHKLDLGWSWMAYTALEHLNDRGTDAGTIAAVALIGALWQAASHATADRTGEAGRLRRRIAEWGALLAWDVGSLNFGKKIRDWSASLAAAEAKVADAKAKAPPSTQSRRLPSHPEVCLADGPSLVVVKGGIPVGNDNSDDKALRKAWQPLTEPLRLAGGVSPKLLATVLLAEFPWLGDVIEALTGDLHLRQAAGEPWAKFRPTIMVGPPGGGKTRLARRLAEILGTGFGELQAAGSSDNRLLAGTARAWTSAQPNFVAVTMRRTMTANPVMLVDELDKTHADGRNGDIRDTLLTMLEGETAQAFPDECLMAPCDLSAVSWLCTANKVEGLRGPLLSRLRVLEAPGPKLEHFDAVLAGMQRDLASELQLDHLPPLAEAAEDALRNALRRGYGLRRIRAALEGAVRAGLAGDRRLH